MKKECMRKFIQNSDLQNWVVVLILAFIPFLKIFFLISHFNNEIKGILKTIQDDQ